MFAVGFGRLDSIVKWLQFADVLFSLAGHAQSILIGLNGALAHLKAVHRHMHRVVRFVPHVRLRWASGASHFGILLLLTNVRYRRVVILPKRLNTSLVLALVELFVAQADLVSLIVYIRRELLLVQVVNDSVRWVVLASRRVR